MKNGFYWLIREDMDPEVVQLDDGDMYRCGSDVTCHFENGQWVEFDEPMNVVQLIGPILPPSTNQSNYYLDEANGICLPAALDRSSLINISTIDDRWASFLDPVTQIIHRCADHFAEYQKQNPAA